MGALLAKIGAVVGGGFGIGKVFGLVKQALTAKNLIKEAREAWDAFDDIPPKLLNIKAQCREVMKDNKITEQEALDFTRDVYDLIKEVEEFQRQAKDVVDIFRK